MNKFVYFFLIAFASVCVNAQSLKWGDQHNGMYKNPILPLDYSDPDAIRVGDKYYMVASDFHFMGMQVMESTDLVNWKVVSQIYDRFDFPGWDENKHYAGGSWAPAIRYHDGRFWVFFCTPDEGLFMSNAEKAEGPWSKLHLVKGVKKWEDPCPFWDDDGQAYLGRSQHGAGPIILHKMTADGKRLLDDGVEIYRGPVAEGTKFYKRDGYYYLCIPEGGVGGGWQTCLRSKNIYGPYERKVVLEQGTTTVNGPHQGAMVDTPSGEWWFLHFQEKSPLGRIVHLQPMHWADGWPVVGKDIDGNGVGEPVMEWTMPEGKASENGFGDINDFGLEWQWNHNPVDDCWSMNVERTELTLTAMMSQNFRLARNTIAQKIVGDNRTARVEVDLSLLAEGQRCGLACMGKKNMLVGVMKQNGSTYLYTEQDELTIAKLPYNKKKIVLELNADAENNEFMFGYSRDGKKFVSIGTQFEMRNGFWKGARVALFCYNTLSNGGKATFRKFSYH